MVCKDYEPKKQRWLTFFTDNYKFFSKVKILKGGKKNNGI